MGLFPSSDPTSCCPGSCGPLQGVTSSLGPASPPVAHPRSALSLCKWWVIFTFRFTSLHENTENAVTWGGWGGRCHHPEDRWAEEVKKVLEKGKEKGGGGKGMGQESGWTPGRGEGETPGSLRSTIAVD